MAVFGSRGSLPILTPLETEGFDVKLACRHAIALLETAGEVGRRSEPAREGDIGKRRLAPRRPFLSREHGQGSLQPHTLDKVVERFTHQQTKNSMEMKRRETRNPGHILEPQGLVEMLQDEINGAIDPLQVGRRFGNALFRLFSQDL